MKLFVKIFLWFLVTAGLMVGVVIFITRTFQTEPMFSRWQRGARTQMSISAGTLAQIYNGEGEAGLKMYIARQRDSETVREYGLVDGAGGTFLGELANEHDFDAVVDRARASGSAEIDTSPTDSALGAVPVTFNDGKKLFLVIRWPPPRTPSLFFDSWRALLRLIGVVLTAILVCYTLALYLTSPIRKLREATQKLADGDLHTRVATRIGRRRDELGDLARDFDVMAERIESLITSQQRLTRDVSHELRSPLARLNVSLEIAKQKANAETQPILERIEKESNRLNEMISRLLMLAKLEGGGEDIQREDVDFADLVREIAADADFEAHSKGRSVVVSAAEECTVIGSENLLRSAVENVLRNAVRYTVEGTAVDVSLKVKNGKAALLVSDHGGGVPDKELIHLFRPFYRVAEARERTTGGIGLGLAIAQRAIHAHKGTILAKNTDDGLALAIQLDCRNGNSRP